MQIPFLVFALVLLCGSTYAFQYRTNITDEEEKLFEELYRIWTTRIPQQPMKIRSFENTVVVKMLVYIGGRPHGLFVTDDLKIVLRIDSFGDYIASNKRVKYILSKLWDIKDDKISIYPEQQPADKAVRTRTFYIDVAGTGYNMKAIARRMFCSFNRNTLEKLRRIFHDMEMRRQANYQTYGLNQEPQAPKDKDNEKDAFRRRKHEQSVPEDDESDERDYSQ